MSITAYLLGLQHIGLPTSDVEKTKAFYESLGFSCMYETLWEGHPLRFFILNGLVIEVYYVEKSAFTDGSWDHIALDVSDIEKTLEEVHSLGYKELEQGIQSMPVFDHGVRYFTIRGPNGEKVEFNQKIRK
ncbi:MAG: VOC family protein [Sphaerochaeta sp.]|jgi:lactoylglutathione lyase|nr:VOC family protein [Sphaerochaeta sp.]